MCTYRKTLGNNPKAQENQLNHGDQTTRNSPRRLSQAPMRYTIRCRHHLECHRCARTTPGRRHASAAGTRRATGRSSPIGNDRPARTCAATCHHWAIRSCAA